MSRKSIVLLSFCCLAVAGTVGIVFTQEKASPANPSEVKQTSVVVSIAGDDDFYVGKEQVTRADIPEKVKQVLKDRPPGEQVVYVNAMCTVKYGIVVSVVDELREAGLNSVGLLAPKGNSVGEPPTPKTKSRAGRDGKIAANPALGQGNITPPTTRMEAVLIEVESKTLVRLNVKAMSLSGLQIALERFLNGRSDKTVFIKAPKGMVYCDVVKVIDIAKGAGAQPVGLRVDLLK